MDLVELVNFRNELCKHSLNDTAVSMDHEIKKINHLLQAQDFVSTEFVNDLQGKYNTVQEGHNKFEQSLDAIKNHVNDLIRHNELSWFTESSHRYKIQFDQKIQKLHAVPMPYTDQHGLMRFGVNPNITKTKLDFVNEILTASIHKSDQIRQLIQTRILTYANWHFTGMIIRPGLESFISDMVANDPLYLVDECLELLHPAMNRFNETYQKRLRPYMVNEYGNAILNKLPDNQFAICVAYNYFDFKPMEVIEQYMHELFTKLCPGGVLAMTFNDCDRPSGIVLAKNFISFYTPSNLILRLAKNIGFQEIFKFNDDGPTTWVELQKPGSLSSLRGGQTLAKINHK